MLPPPARTCSYRLLIGHLYRTVERKMGKEKNNIHTYTLASALCWETVVEILRKFKKKKIKKCRPIAVPGRSSAATAAVTPVDNGIGTAIGRRRRVPPRFTMVDRR